MLVVTLAVALGLFLAEYIVAIGARRDLEREFQSELAALIVSEQVRDAALAERCRTLARKPRIHAALEDNALDLLYPSARDELADVMDGADPTTRESPAYAFHARFYRFLGANGAVISPPDIRDVGELTAGEKAQLALNGLPTRPQIGYLLRDDASTDGAIDEIIAMPIVSSETGETIAALVLGFKPFEPGVQGTAVAIRSGLWLKGHLHLKSVPPSARAALEAQVARTMVAPGQGANSAGVQIEGTPCLLFSKLLNPDSSFPPACQVCIYPLTEAQARQRTLRWQFLGAGALLLLGAYGASQFFSRRLSVPVEKLAVDSEANWAQRERAEAALELTSQELQRSARFSADASHQLKTPVTVLRAGLEELLADENLDLDARKEISDLVHQTFRLACVIDDLLLLSRMDAGRLQINFQGVDLKPLIEAWLDDLGAFPDGLNLDVETDTPPEMRVFGEVRYTSLILQNLFENARKYNRPGGRIRISVRAESDRAVLAVGNTGEPISAEAREHIFERFHRGTSGENIPGHGLGLNLARELARLHGGDLRLARSDPEWTEFEVQFRLFVPTEAAANTSA
jgi:signal transduction histidine kinase